MSGTPDQLRKIADDAEKWDGPTLTSWDHIRHQVETMPGSDIPRMNFETLIGELADRLRQAAAEIERLQADRDNWKAVSAGALKEQFRLAADNAWMRAALSSAPRH